jgi:predicted Zn-dependent protease
MRIPVTYYDGVSATAYAGTLQAAGQMLRLDAGSVQQNFDRQSVRLVSPVGNGPWALELESGARIQFDDEEFGRLLGGQTGGRSLVDRLESGWHWALVALVVAVVGTWALLTYGVPVAAKHIAFSVPVELDQRLSDASMDLLDRLLFEDSELAEERKGQVQSLFAVIIDTSAAYQHYQLEFRKSASIGANAFAVPGGLVVITDEMVDLTETDTELSAVLAHEIGHLAGRHGLRILLQDSASAVIIAGLTGDLTNVTAFSATVPTLLMQSKYSRDFERVADDFAFEFLRSKGMDPDVLAALFLRLEELDGNTGSESIPSWLSSHPRSDERVPGDE